MRILRRTVCAFLAACWFLSLPAAAVEDAAARFDELAARYSARTEGREDAGALRTALEAEAVQADAFALWRSLFREGIAPREGASNALSLLNALLDDGDPALWESASGFFLPSFVPKPLAAADAVYASALFLLRMEEEGAAELAGMLFERLLDSPKGKYYFVSTSPAEYREIVRMLMERGVVPSFGKWPEGVAEGTLPLGAPVRGRVSLDRAISEGMVFLNGAGQPAPNGMVAWDRKKGRIYDVVDVERRRFWFCD